MDDLHNFLFQDFSVEDLQKKLRPGGASYCGFMGEQESLLEIVQNDSEVLKKHNVTHAEIANALRNVLKSEQQINPDYEHTGHSSFMGYQECPWGCDARCSDLSYLVAKKNTSESLMINRLAPHLIEKHHFFQGEKSPYRLPPEKLMEALGFHLENYFLDHLLAEIESGDTRLQHYAFERLTRFRKGKDYFSVLIGFLNDEISEETVVVILKTLGKFAIPETAVKIASYVHHDSCDVREAAICALKDMGAHVVPILKELLKDSDTNTKIEICKIITQIPQENTVKVQEVRQRAERDIDKSLPKYTISKIFDLLKSEDARYYKFPRQLNSFCDDNDIDEKEVRDYFAKNPELYSVILEDLSRKTSVEHFHFLLKDYRECLRSPDDKIQKIGVRALEHLVTQQNFDYVADDFLKIIQTRDNVLLHDVGTILRRFSQLPSDIVNTLRHLLHNGNSIESNLALYSLSGVCKDYPDVWDKYLKHFDNPNRIDFVKDLYLNVGEQATEILQQKFYDSPLEVQKHILQVLSRIASLKSLEFFSENLGHSDFEIRQVSAITLCEMNQQIAASNALILEELQGTTEQKQIMLQRLSDMQNFLHNVYLQQPLHNSIKTAIIDLFLDPDERVSLLAKDLYFQLEVNRLRTIDKNSL